MRKQYRQNKAAKGPGPTFICEYCQQVAVSQPPGTKHRNHCPRCLWSLHVDIGPGDRISGCRGLMEPIAVWVRYNDEWAIVHRCKRCRILRINRIAGDDNELVLISLALRPLARPPFPLDGLELKTKRET